MSTVTESKGQDQSLTIPQACEGLNSRIDGLEKIAKVLNLNNPEGVRLEFLSGTGYEFSPETGRLSPKELGEDFDADEVTEAKAARHMLKQEGVTESKIQAIFKHIHA